MAEIGNKVTILKLNLGKIYGKRRYYKINENI